jgi:rare lipoprotein A
MQAKKSVSGSITRLATALTLTAATFTLATTSDASAKSRRHNHHHSSWQDAQASIGGGGRSFSGMASFYGNESGNKTASGQRFNQHAMTAAHRSLPFGTKLRVSYGGSSVVVTVNDRGPFIRGRVLDLSKGAAQAIGLTSRGVGRVVAEVI